MSGGGKGGGKKTTTETTVPEWVRGPADRNLQRAEALQQIEYMPYYGPQVAAFNDNQAAAFQNNNNAASAFGLLAPTDAMSSMPTPTTYANGMKGYSSIPLYDQAMKELTEAYPDNMDAYSKLFGNSVPVNVPPPGTGGGGGGGGGGNVTITPSPSDPTFTPNYDTSTWSPELQKSHAEQIDPNSTVNTLDASYGLTKDGLIGGNTGSGTNYKAIVKQNKMDNAMSSYQPRTSSKPSNSPGHPSNAGKSYSAPKAKKTYKSKGGTYNAYRHVGGR